MRQIIYRTSAFVEVGERVKLHNNMKGTVRFVGIVHWHKQDEMVGLELSDGEGDTNGTRDGKTEGDTNGTRDGKTGASAIFGNF